MDVKRPKPAWRLFGKRNALIGIGVLATAGIFATVFNLGKALPAVMRANLWLDSATRGDMVREIRVNGTLVPRDIRWVTAGTAANVQEVLVQPGATVLADSVVMRLVNPAVESNLAKAKAAQAGAQADFAAKRSELASQALEQKAAVASGEAAFEISRAKAKAMGEAYNMGAVAKIDFDQSQIILGQNQHLLEITKQRESAFNANMEAPLRAAQAQLDQVNSALAVARRDVDALNVKAGIAGILQQVSVEPGQKVEAGANLARVAKPSPLVSRLQVPETQAKDLSPGLPVRVDTHNGIAEGTIGRIDPAVRNGSVLVDVNFEGELPKGARPDLSVDGRVILNTLRNAISIARPALATANSNGTLFVMTPGSDIARRRRVVYGAASSDRVEVVQGIVAGEQVILSDMSRWSDYDAVQVK